MCKVCKRYGVICIRCNCCVLHCECKKDQVLILPGCFQ